MVHQAPHRLIPRPAWIALILALILGTGATLSAQQPADCLHDAFSRQDYASARRCLGPALRQSPVSLLPHLDDIAYMLLEHGAKDGNEIAGRPQTDTLLAIYHAAALLDPARRPALLSRRALIAHRFPDHYGSQLLPWLQEALLSEPLACPLLLYSLLLDANAERGPGLDSTLSTWASLNRLLDLRALSNPDEALECGLLQRKLSHAMRARMPACADWGTRLRAAQPWTLRAVESYLTGASLSGCTDTLLWDKAAAWLSAQGSVRPEIAMLLMAEALQRQQATQAQAWLDQAIAAEPDPARRAMDLLFMVELLRIRQDYRGARALLQKAILLNPAWGEPYIRLADLYREGSRSCSLSDFDRKAVNWLLLDLYHRAAEADPSYAQEASTRIQACRAAMPDALELKRHGLHPGDTWPLRCWMGVAAVVPAP